MSSERLDRCADGNLLLLLLLLNLFGRRDLEITMARAKRKRDVSMYLFSVMMACVVLSCGSIYSEGQLMPFLDDMHRDSRFRHVI